MKTTVKIIQSIMVAAALVVLPLAGSQSVDAAASGSLFTYDLRNAASSVSNSAAANAGADLQLSGDYTSTADGVEFTGNTVVGQSAGIADPSGTTLDVAANEAVGASVVFTADFTNSICANDSENITQIGRYANGETQIKLQLGKCNNANGLVKPECRIVGNSSPNGAPVVKGPRVIAEGVQYKLTCVKSPDVSGQTTISMELVNLDSNTVVVDTDFTVSAMGALSSSKDVAVANKAPLPSQSGNTDQFKGLIAVVSYCSGASTTAVEDCLDTETTLGQTPSETTVVVASGVRDSSRVTAPKWVEVQWTSPVSGSIDSVMTWDNPTADMRYTVKDSSGTTMVSSGQTTSGTVETFTAVQGETYDIASWAKSGVSDHEITFTYQD